MWCGEMCMLITKKICIFNVCGGNIERLPMRHIEGIENKKN
jgi:hypothetical protein